MKKPINMMKKMMGMYMEKGRKLVGKYKIFYPENIAQHSIEILPWLQD